MWGILVWYLYLGFVFKSIYGNRRILSRIMPFKESGSGIAVNSRRLTVDLQFEVCCERILSAASCEEDGKGEKKDIFH
jgi:hypothetical protein